MNTDILEQMRTSFRAEAADLVVELDAALLSLETTPGDTDVVHRVFRAIHTIKGSGATAGFAHMAAFAHNVEEAFDLARSGRLPVSPELVDCGLKACDILRDLLSGADSETTHPGEQAVTGILARLTPTHPAQGEAEERVPQGVAVAGRVAYQIVIRPHAGLFAAGADPMTLIDELRELGPAHIAAHTDKVPVISLLEPKHCYLWWEVRLVTERGEPAIQAVFEFVDDICDVEIALLEDQTAAVALLGTIPVETLELFAVESCELLDSMESDALALETAAAPGKRLASIFRAVHSIKGNSGLLLGQVSPAVLPPKHALPLLSRTAHALEELLESLRMSGESKPVGGETVAILLDGCDAMRGMVQNLAGRAPLYELPQALAERLSIGQAGAAAPAVSAFENTSSQCLELVGTCLQRMEAGQVGEAVLKTYLRGLKTLAAAARNLERKDLDEPTGIQLRILEAAIGAGRVLSERERGQLEQAFTTVRERVAGTRDPAPVVKAETPRARVKDPASSGGSTIRVEQEKLDRLMRVVGELLVARGSIPALASKLAAGEDRGQVARSLKEAGAGISRIAEELQASVMAIRMLPVKTVFQRFPRLVRDLARSLGKDVKLVIEGENTELDKTILERIGDPLVHLVRNGLDHGLERPEQRQARGKAPVGCLTLRARNATGSVIIEIIDDGAGLDAEKLKRKASEKGLVSAEVVASMSDEAAYQLVFLPGLSTADQVTDVSGRGVGMDVVRSNITDLQGSIKIISKPGEGTTFQIKLPTSVMVSKGILLEAGGEEFILPLGAIRDMVKVPQEHLHQFRGQTLVQLRGEVYAVFGLSDVLGLQATQRPEVSIAVIDTGTIRYGMIADRFVSEVEVLVKPLTGGLEGSKEFHGAAILGDGRVVLVLNPVACHRLEDQK